MARGKLRVYLGAAPGVGKTFRMLGEGQRRAARGGDVVVGLLETHGRTQTAVAAEGLEVVPRRSVTYRGATFGEMDVEAIVARHPELVLVDELAHTNIPGTANEKRWQDVVALLDAGINVITTVNIQHLESLNDVVEKITGVPQRETVPDAIVRAADQIELVDMTAEALRRRLAHGNVYAPEKVDAALAQYFRVGNLTALRELALLWLADSVEEGLQRYREAHHIDRTWETRERVVVALTGGPEGELLIRRAARVAARGSADLLAVHVARTDGLSSGTPANLPELQALVESLGGRYHVLAGDNPAEAVLQFARAEDATQLVVGASRRRWISRVLGGLGTAASIIRESGSIDVHIVTHDYVDRGRLPQLARGLSRRRQLLACLLGGLGLLAVTALLAQLRGELTLASIELVYLVVVIAVALVGGLVPAVAAAVLASGAVNYWFTPPLYSFTISDRNNALALAAFVLVAAAVSVVVDLAAKRAGQAARSSAEAEVLSALAGTVLAAAEPLPALLEQLREVFGADAAALQERQPDGGWTTTTRAGAEPGQAAQRTLEAVSEDSRLVVYGRPLSGSDIRLLRAFAGHVGAVRRTERLQQEAAAARTAEAGDKVRTALLSAVGHDLRTPLATIKASASALLDDGVTLAAEDRQELLTGIESAADRLTRLVANLLDMSRLVTGEVAPVRAVTSIHEVVGKVVRSLADHPAAARLQVELDEELPAVLVDAGLTERVLRLVTENALAYGGPQPVLVQASCLGDRMEVRVADRGPGLDRDGKERSFQPFQRMDDVPSGTGIGLGLAVARGLAEAQGGALEPEDTPGGGLTMVLTLPLATGQGAAGSADLVSPARPERG
ncbi:MAG: two-component system, OmpR family, sensor histidine kinase KdpD [Frankiales bacterium]|nr:two-component system, OmpR family, sensor histidine kinase KdpD [Frankiales bacterium]